MKKGEKWAVQKVARTVLKMVAEMVELLAAVRVAQMVLKLVEMMAC